MRRPTGWALGVLVAVLGAAWLPTSAQAATPQVEATWVADVTASSATLHAQVDPEGIESTYRFEYLTEAAYLAAGESFLGAARLPSGREPGLGSAETAQPAIQRLAGLAPATSYRYRILVTGHCDPAAPAEECVVPGPARLFTTQETSIPTGLPDGRGWELVSPVEKNGGQVQGLGASAGGGVLQAAADGDSATYSSTSSFGAGAQGAPTASQYISTRTEAGWSTENVTVPTLSGSYGAHPEGVPYQLFSPDLARALLLAGARCGEGEACPRGYLLRGGEGGALTPTPTAPDLRFVGSSPDLRHVVLSTCAALTPEANEIEGVGGSCNPAETNLYEWSEGALSLINAPTEHHAQLAARSGAISGDGDRVYFTAGEDSPILLREAGRPLKFIAATIGGAGAFQLASADGSLAFFTVGGDLYRYDALTEATSEPLATEVEGVLGASEDGSHLYYASRQGIFLWDDGTTTEVAPGPEAALASDYPPATGTARVSPDGSHLAFLSDAELTGYENTDATTGLPDSELYLYDAAGRTLTCASCNPTGERPLGPSTIPGASANGSGPAATHLYKPRDLSADGDRLFFDSTDRLLPQDTSAAADVYEWEAAGEGSCGRPGGCVFLISSGHGAQASEFIDASTTGSDVFFLTADSLVGSDPGSVDLYDAREGGGFPEPTPQVPCEGDACQALPSPPEDPLPGTTVAAGPNPPAHWPRTHHRKKKAKKKGKNGGKAAGKHHRHPHGILGAGHLHHHKGRRSGGRR